MENGWERPPKPVAQWSDAQKETASFNNKAMNKIFNAVSIEEFKRFLM